MDPIKFIVVYLYCLVVGVLMLLIQLVHFTIGWILYILVTPIAAYRCTRSGGVGMSGYLFHTRASLFNIFRPKPPTQDRRHAAR